MMTGEYFILKKKFTGKFGFSSIQKYTSSIQVLSCGVVANAVNSYIRIAKSTCLEAIYRLCAMVVVVVFGWEYLREPNGAHKSWLMSKILLLRMPLTKI
jgi:hypothetical protein